MPLAELPACVFCGEPIGPGEETAGRLPAHASCADAALADDAHWDAIHAAGGGDEPDGPSEGQEPSQTTAARAGCLTLVAMSLLVPALAAILR